MDKWRRYVRLVVNNCTGTYPLRRIDASSLFYPANQAMHQVKFTDTPPDEALLPRPYISFSPSLDDRVITDIATPQEAKCCEPISVALGDALYVMDSKPIPGRHGCFDALTLGPSKDLLCTILQWNWRSLQPPPFMLEPGYKTTRICAYTVVGSSSILISMPHIGTYSFDTVSSSWNKAGDWELPFHRRADFVPEHGVWLGFSAEDDRPCYSSDLGASMQRQPALEMVWDDDPTVKMVCCDLHYPQKYTRILKSDLVHLGSGRFCVARLYERVENELIAEGYLPQVEAFVVLTGMELKPGEFGKKGIKMIPLKSLLYKSEGMAYCWVS